MVREGNRAVTLPEGQMRRMDEIAEDPELGLTSGTDAVRMAVREFIRWYDQTWAPQREARKKIRR